MLEYLLKFMADGNAVERESDSVISALGRIQNAAMAVAGALGIGLSLRSVVDQFKQAIDFGGQVADLSKRLSVAPEVLQAWTFAAKQTGASIGDVQAAFRSLTLSIAEAASDPKGETAKMFEKFGIGADVLANPKLRTDMVFGALSEHLGQQAPSPQTDAMAMRLLGRSGMDLMGAFRGGFSEQYSRAMQEGSGLVNREATISKLESAGDKLDELMTKLAVGRNEVVGDIISQQPMEGGSMFWKAAMLAGKEMTSILSQPPAGAVTGLLAAPGRIEEGARNVVVEELLRAIRDELVTQTRKAEE